MTKQKDAEPWGEPKLLRLHERPVYATDKTLVVINPASTDKSVAKSKFDPAQDASILVTIDAIAYKIIASDKMVRWSDRSLAQSIACDDNCDAAEMTIAKKYLPEIRGNKGFKTSEFYVPPHGEKSGYWRGGGPQ